MLFVCLPAGGSVGPSCAERGSWDALQSVAPCMAVEAGTTSTVLPGCCATCCVMPLYQSVVGLRPVAQHTSLRLPASGGKRLHARPMQLLATSNHHCTPCMYGCMAGGGTGPWLPPVGRAPCVHAHAQPRALHAPTIKLRCSGAAPPPATSSLCLHFVCTTLLCALGNGAARRQQRPPLGRLPAQCTSVGLARVIQIAMCTVRGWPIAHFHGPRLALPFQPRTNGGCTSSLCAVVQAAWEASSGEDTVLLLVLLQRLHMQPLCPFAQRTPDPPMPTPLAISCHGRATRAPCPRHHPPGAQPASSCTAQPRTATARPQHDPHTRPASHAATAAV